MAPTARALPPAGTALLLALVFALLLFRLGAVPLAGPDEPRYARVAVEMARAGEWVRPTLQGQPWLEKPPLYYWMAGAAFRGLGETEAAARLPSLLATLLLVGTTALVGARLYGSAAGLHSGFVCGTGVLVFVYGHAASMDMLLAAAVTLAIGLAGLRLLGIAGGLALPAAGLLAGVGTLAKGPLGLLLPLLVVVGYAAVTRDRRALRAVLSSSPWAILAFAVAAGPWYVAILRDQGRAFVDVFLLDHNLQRFTTTVHRHPGPFYYYLPLLLLGLFPWAGLLLPGLGALRPRLDRRDLFLLLWLALPLAFFSAAGSKLPGYILPCVPPLALMAGRAADLVVRQEPAFRPGLGPRAAGLLTLALAAGVALAPVVLLIRGEPYARLLMPFGVFSLLTALACGRRLGSDPAGALRLLRVGAAGGLALLALAAPPLVARRESGRDLFIPARGREVLAWGAVRAAWMAGYFYNDGRVRPVESLAEITQAAATAPTLVLCGPAERQRLERLLAYRATVLAEGMKRNTLMRVEPR
jgi:4-amino-4-deoxy-L-arabinose transferase-like glycosyltransferase